MICDAHVHMGYWRVMGELRYYSPRRIVGVLNRCGVDEFIVSSTSPQAGAIDTVDLIREAREVKRLAGARAHVYCWITGTMYDRDPGLKILDGGVYDGVKLHECETRWNFDRRDDFCRILDSAAQRGLNVMLHCGYSDGCRPKDLKWVAEEYAGVKFNFAHCCPVDEILQVMRDCKNVYSDVSCLPGADITSVLATEVDDRVLWGSDLPAVCGDMKMTNFYRGKLNEIRGLEDKFNFSFRKFIRR